MHNSCLTSLEHQSAWLLQKAASECVWSVLINQLCCRYLGTICLWFSLCFFLWYQSKQLRQAYFRNSTVTTSQQITYIFIIVPIILHASSCCCYMNCRCVPWSLHDRNTKGCQFNCRFKHLNNKYQLLKSLLLHYCDTSCLLSTAGTINNNYVNWTALLCSMRR